MSSATPEARTAPLNSPSQVPRGTMPGPAPTAPAASASDMCVNFNLPDSRVVCLSVPVNITSLDAEFILTVLQAHVTATVRRGR